MHIPVTRIRQFCLVLLPFVAAPLLSAQSVPVVQQQTENNGFGLPRIGGSLRYSLTASENFLLGDNNGNGGGTSAYTDFSGNLGYLSKSKLRPFSAVYSGGYLFGSGNYPSNSFQNLAVSQVLTGKNLTFVISDFISYTPQTADVGLSGIPGVGDVGVPPVTVTGTPGFGLLTTFGGRVTNTASATLLDALTGKTSLSFTGGDTIERYTGKNTTGIGNDLYTATGGVTHVLNPRTSFGGLYAFTNASFSYGGSVGAFGYITHSLEATYQHRFTRRVNLQVAAGPQLLVNRSGNLLSSDSVSITASGALTYAGDVYTDTLSFNRSTNNGNGVVIGSEQTTVNAIGARRLGRTFGVSANAGYNHSASLPNLNLASYTSDAEVVGAQLSARLSNSFSAFSSYTLERQSFSGYSAAGNAFNGTIQNLAFGITYSPKAILTAR